MDERIAAIRVNATVREREESLPIDGERKYE
jgi:hypothetical protein